MERVVGTAIGKLTQETMRRINGGGHALPGLIVERLHPTFLSSMLQQLPEGVIVVTGTNGKTTTSKILVELLQVAGKRVITNATGSNLGRGLISGILQHASWKGELPYDVAVFEIDEAYAKKFISQVKPRWVLALNVSRDQLDRFGEVDKVAELVGVSMRAATVGVVTNADDPYLLPIGKEISSNDVKVSYFGVSRSMQKFFPHESLLASVENKNNKYPTRPKSLKVSVELIDFKGQKAAYKINGKKHEVELRLSGQHNFQNAAGALALAIELLPEVPLPTHLSRLSKISTAFGRGEVYTLKDGSSIQLVLAKNPASFLQAITSYYSPEKPVMIAINDNYADSRDVSWLWDVDFSAMSGKQIMATTGTRATDMALRLSYDDVSVSQVIPDINKALKLFTEQKDDKVIFSTYTAMLHLHSILSKEAGKSL